MFKDKADLLELAKAGYNITVINDAKTVYIGCQFGGGSRKKKQTSIETTETVEVEVEVVEEVSDSSPFKRDESPAETQTVESNPKAEKAYKKLLVMENDLTVNIDFFSVSFFSDEKNAEILTKILSANDADQVDDILSDYIESIIDID